MSERSKQKIKQNLLIISIFVFLGTLGFTSLETKADLVFQEIRQWQIASDLTANINPNAPDITANWVPSSAVDHYTLIDEGTTPDTADNLLGGNLITDEFNMESFSVAEVTQIQVYLHAYATKAALISVTLYWTGGNSATQTVNPTTGYTWLNTTFAGLTLTPSQFDSLSIRIVSAGSGGRSTYVATLYATVTYSAANIAPVVQNVSLNGGSSFSPVPGGVVAVTVSGEVIDDDGCANISNIESQAFVTIDNNLDCTFSTETCYSGLVCTSSCAGTVLAVSCPASIYFYAEATDDDTDEWVGAILATDSSNATAENNSSAESVEYNGALCISVVPASIAYGGLSKGSDTGATNQSVLIYNVCNTAIDTSVSGTNMTTAAGASTIYVSEQQYSTEAYTYSDGTSNTLLVTGANLEIDAAKPTAAPSNSSDEIFWGIGIPAGATDATDYGGTNTFTAIND